MLEEIKQAETYLKQRIPAPVLKGAFVIGIGFVAVWGFRMFIRTRLENKLTEAQTKDLEQQMQLRKLEIDGKLLQMGIAA